MTAPHDEHAKTLAPTRFWLDGGYDFELVQACAYHPAHKWTTLRLSEVLVPTAYGADDVLTICQGCYVPRCGSISDSDRCTLWRHHETMHVYESGKAEPVGHCGKAW